MTRTTNPLASSLTRFAYSAATIRKIESKIPKENQSLMQEVGIAAATTAKLMLKQANIGIEHSKVVILAGSGANGGDGIYAGVNLISMGANVTVVATGEHLHKQALQAFNAAGGSVLPLSQHASIAGFPSANTPTSVQNALQNAVKLASSSNLIIDAMTGMGCEGALHSTSEELVNQIRKLTGRDNDTNVLGDSRCQSQPLVEAIDIPSGVGIDDGSLPGAYLPADVTVCCGALKPCCLLPPAAYTCGKIVLVELGYDLTNEPAAVEAIDATTCKNSIRQARVHDNKYSRGVVGLVTGSENYPGAAVLSTCAAASSGAGMVRYVGPRRASDAVLAAMPEVVLGEGRVQAWVLGSGVSTAQSGNREDPQRSLISTILKEHGHYPKLATFSNETNTLYAPIIVDAGALDVLPDMLSIEKLSPNVVLTPHSGELASLLTWLGEATSSSQIADKPLNWALRACTLTGATILLKGAITIVVTPDLDGRTHVFTTGSGPAWLSTAGSGDVLAGIEGSLLATQAEHLTGSTNEIGRIIASGAFIHGMAGSLASHSHCKAWEPAIVFTSGHITQFIHDAEQAWNMPRNCGEETTYLGHPIHASELTHSIERALQLILDVPSNAPSPLDT